MTTDDAGELSGVSIALLVAGLSIVMMLDIESRNCWFLVALRSSRAASMAFIFSCRDDDLAFKSVCRRIISPLTVSLSLMPFCIIDNTRSIADP